MEKFVPASHSAVAVTLPAVCETEPASLACAAGAASAAAASTAAATVAHLRRRTRPLGRCARRRGLGLGRGLLLGGRGLEAVLRPRLVELDAPAALVVLDQREARA